MDKDLERYGKLKAYEKFEGLDLDENKELKNIESKLNEKLEKAEKYDILNEVFEDYPKGWLDMKKDLEQQIKQLKEELQNIPSTLRLAYAEIQKLKEQTGVLQWENLQKEIQSLKTQLEQLKDLIYEIAELNPDSDFAENTIRIISKLSNLEVKE